MKNTSQYVDRIIQLCPEMMVPRVKKKLQIEFCDCTALSWGISVTALREKEGEMKRWREGEESERGKDKPKE